MNESYRIEYGCRLEDNQAVASSEIKALEGAYRIDHCPGIYISSIWMNSLYDLMLALDCGYHLGEYLSAQNNIAVNVMTLTDIRRRIKAFHG